MVVLNRIYTRTGDDGTTALGSGRRVEKYAIRINAYGTVDETNAAVGVARLHAPAIAPDLDVMLARVQNDLCPQCQAGTTRWQTDASYRAGRPRSARARCRNWQR